MRYRVTIAPRKDRIVMLCPIKRNVVVFDNKKVWYSTLLYYSSLFQYNVDMSSSQMLDSNAKKAYFFGYLYIIRFDTYFGSSTGRFKRYTSIGHVTHYISTTLRHVLLHSELSTQTTEASSTI